MVAWNAIYIEVETLLPRQLVLSARCAATLVGAKFAVTHRAARHPKRWVATAPFS